ncbi:hypothetical protein HHK36_026003 [Tetracentron sinense]|uniref:RING-type E3 ubiquitin transferase n=1 Tax=Tetracentron sinense TaxID=13715 RepID=A0A834YM91_TETSI|nr:hypothetical protein HHK36_026003 [Tetracentron sinense]
MDLFLPEIKAKDYLSPSQEQPFFPSQQPSPLVQSTDNRISPSILIIIVIVSIIFFISGFLHLLVKSLFKSPNTDPEDSETVTAFEGQLQQLFHLHDSGVNQSFIDTLPVFLYKTIIGLKNPFDCAVCLCEFEAEAKLRLLPKCSHAFHLECIDTWLLSHSTCPLCRSNLLPDFSPNNCCSPIVLVLESGSESSREIVSDREAVLGTNSTIGTSFHLGFHGEDELVYSCNDFSQKSWEIPVKEDSSPAIQVVSEEKIVPVKLGKFRNMDSIARGGGEGSSSNSSVDARRCFSMGSFEYVMDESSYLQVPIRPPIRKQSLSLTPGHRPAMSECDCNSKREGFKGFEEIRSTGIQGGMNISTENSIRRSKGESFSISKIWLRSKEKLASTEDSSRRAISFRFPLHQTVAGDLKQKQTSSSRTISKIDISRSGYCGSELGFDEEVGSCRSIDSEANPTSFARRKLLWLVGRQNKVVHSSSSTNV